MSSSDLASDNMQQNAVGLGAENPFRRDLELRRELPAQLRPLDRISQNFFWSWHPEGIELFRELDPDLWIEKEQHPRGLLNSVSELRLWQVAADDDYLKKLSDFSERFESYMGDAARPADSDLVAYFCAEYGVHNSLPNYSGGLGILAGDHLKSASDLNFPLVAVGLLYRFGYFRQDIAHDGWQEEHYKDIFETDLALKPVIGSGGERTTVMVHIRGREVHAQAWLAEVGRISLYMLDTNVPQNAEVDRLITGHLYGGDSETRIVQEKVLGIGGVRLLRKLGIAPATYHLNEGHSAFLTLELAKEHLEREPAGKFQDAAAAVRRQCVFTTHTPVAAGNDVFSPTQLRDCFDANYLAALKLSEEEFFALGRVDQRDAEEPFGMTPFALRMCRSANGVSKKHGEVSRKLWAPMFPNAKEVPITHVTNGVHPRTWIAVPLQDLFTRTVGSNWAEAARKPKDWAEATSAISDSDLWRTHQILKNLLIAFIRERTRRKETGLQDTINERTDTHDLFSADVLTIGFARRVAQYKRWNLILSDLNRLLQLVDDRERPVQFVFAGKAHPQDRTAKQILQQLMSINHDSQWQRRAVFVEDYDQEVARYLVQGVDVWMNVPRRPHEASGTSGMKAAMNGVLNFSILDGWWIEGCNGSNGFAIGGMDELESDGEADASEAKALYDALETEVVPLFYRRDERGIPLEWVAHMRDAIATLTPQFSSDRMVTDYIHRIYSD